jgi:hypothetical protein
VPVTRTNRDELLQAIEDVAKLKPAEIAAALKRKKILGRPGTVGRCPLALMMHGSRGGHFYVGQKSIIRQSGGQVDTVKTPPNLAAFVRMFDAGRFNDLIDVPPRCHTGGYHASPGKPAGTRTKPHSRKRGPERLHLARQVERFKVQP